MLVPEIFKFHQYQKENGSLLCCCPVGRLSTAGGWGRPLSTLGEACLKLSH